jgi:hypothetical protein
MARPPDFDVQPNRCLTRVPCADDGTNRIEIWSRGDGDCLFHSMAYLLRQAGLRGAGTQVELRTEAVQLLRTWFGTVAAPGASRDWVKAQLVLNGEPGVLAGTVGNALQTAVEAYLTRMDRPGTYGDPLCVAAIEDLYDVAILAYTRQGVVILPATNAGGAQTLRVAYVSYSGKGDPNHFNPLIADTGQVIPHHDFAALEALDVPLGELSLAGEGAQLYAPPMRHADFPALPTIDRTTSLDRGLRSLLVSISGENVVQIGGPVFAGFALSWQPPKGNASSAPPPVVSNAGTPRAYADRVDSKRLFRARLTAPLKVGEGGLTPDVDGDALEVFLTMTGAYADTTPLELRLEGRTGSNFVLRRLEFTWGNMGKNVSESNGAAQRQCALSAIDKSNALLAGLDWKDSPFRLTIWSSAAGNRTEPVCAYFNVPAPLDVVGLAQVAQIPVLPIGDLMAPLAKLKIDKAVIEPLGDNPRPKIPGSVQRLIGTAFIQAISKKASADPNGVFDPNSTSIALVDGNRMFVQTSWASFAVLRREKGKIFLHWLGAAGERDCYLANLYTEPDDHVELFVPPHFDIRVPNYFGEKKYAEQRWRIFDFTTLGELPEVSTAVTTGISSCAGGLTLPAEDPDYLILWHFDANVSVVVPQLASMLWPKKVPALRTIAFVYPQPEEIRKYRHAILYPPEVVKTSETLLLMRGTHLGSVRFATGCGHNEFGVTFEDGVPFLTGTYGFDRRIWTMPTGRPDAYYERALLDYSENLFEEYRHLGATPATGQELRDYCTLRTNGPRVSSEVLPAQRALESFYKLPLAETWAAVAKAVRPLASQPICNIGLKGTWELAHTESPLVQEHPAPKAKQEAKKAD